MEESASLEAEASGVGNLVGHQALPLPPPRRPGAPCSLAFCVDSEISLSVAKILEKEMATHSSVLAWRIPGMAEPGGLQSMGSHRDGHDRCDLAAAAAAKIQRCFGVHATDIAADIAADGLGGSRHPVGGMSLLPKRKTRSGRATSSLPCRAVMIRLSL